jgi:hypothetical protein
MASEGMALTSHHLVLGIRLEFAGDDAVHRQHDGAAGRRRLDHDLLGGVGEVVLAERLADIGAAGGEEGVGHAAADDQRVDLLDEVHEQVDLGGDLGAADDGDRPGGAALPSAFSSASSSACMVRPA